MTRAERLRGSVEERVAALQEISTSASATSDEIDLLIDSLGDERKAVQRRAAEAAAACAPNVSTIGERLEQILRDGPWRQRWGAAFALSLFAGVRISMLPTLLDALASSDGDVRWAAADLLKKLAKHETSTPIALVQAARDGAVNQRKMSLYILRDLQCQDGMPAALDGLGAAALEVRLAALSALVILAQDKDAAAARVLPLLDDADARMRRAAAAALGQLAVATDSVVVALEAAAKTDDPSLRRAAAGALLRISAR